MKDNLYTKLINFYNVNDENFKEFMAEFYKLTNEAIKKNEIQGDLIKELQRMFEEFNENGIDENTVREKVNYFIENSVKIKNIISKLTRNANNIENINSELENIESEKASNTSLKELESRVDRFTSLQEGSTTGDAELIDGRISAFGYEYTNIGSSIREQIKTILKTKSLTKTIEVNDSFNGEILRCEVPFLKGQRVKLKIESNDIFDIEKIHLGYIDYNNSNVDGMDILFPNTFIEHTFKSDTKGIRLWMDPIYKLKNGTVNFICNYTSTLNEDIQYFYDDINELNKLNQLVLGDKELISETANYTISFGYDFNAKMDMTLEPNTKYCLRVNTNCVNSTDSGIVLGVRYETTGEQGDVALFNPNELISFTTKSEKAISFRIWIASKYITSTGALNMTISNFGDISLMERIDAISHKTEMASGTFSIIGDSYSSYKKWIPSSYAHWYADEGNSEQNNVSSVKDTWFWKLSNETGLKLLFNSSYSGSTICNTGYNGNDSTSTSFITRVKKDIGEERTLQPKPNIIFVFGGTNDSWAGSPIGSLKYNDWSAEDLKTVLPAFCYLIDYLKTWNPGARIINIVNTDLKSDIINGMAAACEHYGIENLVLSNIDKENGHPNIAGMEEIKNQIIKIL